MKDEIEDGSHCCHCYHTTGAPIFMVVPPDHVYQFCCQCGGNRIIHKAHALDDKYAEK